MTCSQAIYFANEISFWFIMNQFTRWGINYKIIQSFCNSNINHFFSLLNKICVPFLASRWNRHSWATCIGFSISLIAFSRVVLQSCSFSISWTCFSSSDAISLRQKVTSLILSPNLLLVSYWVCLILSSASLKWKKYVLIFFKL